VSLPDPTQSIKIPILLWAKLIPELRRRGRGVRESGAFLLAERDHRPRAVCAVQYYDDLDPNALNGAIAFHDTGYSALWAYCRQHGLAVIADVHTHPGSGVGQSTIDQRNPMMPKTGHTGLIVPHYAHASRWSLQGVGVHEYLGNFVWRRHQYGQHVRLTWW
jgi:proteasome lid subunit RPN8/RPN11